LSSDQIRPFNGAQMTPSFLDVFGVGYFGPRELCQYLGPTSSFTLAITCQAMNRSIPPTLVQELTRSADRLNSLETKPIPALIFDHMMSRLPVGDCLDLLYTLICRRSAAEGRSVASESALIPMFDLLGPILNEWQSTTRLGPRDTVEASGVLVCVAFGRDAVRILMLLLTLGADLDHSPPDWPYLRPVIIASRRGDRRILELLLNAADTSIVSCSTVRPTPPLLPAVASCDTAVCELLLAKKADVNEADKLTGTTPLHVATRCSSKRMCEFLLYRGADPSRLDAAGRSALDEADEAEVDSVAEILRAVSPSTYLTCFGQRK
ncbi:hypothetical protein FOZ62_026040, partial [Perkinsus olseni]